MSDEYLGHSNDRVKFDSRYIGVPTAGMEPYFPFTPNIIIKYDPSMWFNHDFYFPGSAYMTESPTKNSECGGFVSTSGPDSAFRMPRDVERVSCTWVASSNIEPYYGRRDMDVISMSSKMPNGGWEYITYPRLTAQSNNVGHADFTTWGSGTCEIHRFYQPNITDFSYMGNNSNYTAIRNFYCPNLTSMNTAFSIVDWGTAPTPRIAHNILELENFYAPKVKQASGTWAEYSATTITSMKNVEVGSALALTLQKFSVQDRDTNRYTKRYITNYTGHQDAPTIWPQGISGDTNLDAMRAYDRRMVLNGDIVLDAHLSSTVYFTAGKLFISCDFGTQSATNVYLGPKNKAIYENSAISASACFMSTARGAQCKFGTYPVKFYTQFPPQ